MPPPQKRASFRAQFVHTPSVLRAPYTFDDAVYFVGSQLNAAYSDRAMLDVRYNSFLLPVPIVPPPPPRSHSR